MTVSSFLALLPLLLGVAATQDQAPGDEPQPAVSRLVVERQWIVRVPVRPHSAPRRFEWNEGKRVKCFPTNAIRGALLSGADHVDFLLRPRQRVRATFDGNCPALDFYGGFYLKTDDDRVCARRDFVHSRMGGSCRIERFRQLVPRIKD
ncbi:MAG TPA: hypothetical protein VFU20_07930 [Sphingomicrobium sp.]|nr:hypothetical protein [Sphingomicrobium sp.]